MQVQLLIEYGVFVGVAVGVRVETVKAVSQRHVSAAVAAELEAVELIFPTSDPARIVEGVLTGVAVNQGANFVTEHSQEGLRARIEGMVSMGDFCNPSWYPSESSLMVNVKPTDTEQLSTTAKSW